MTTSGKHLRRLIERYPALEECAADTSRAFDVFAEVFSSGHKLLICGNGGSAADSEHMVGELMKGFMRPRTIAPAHVEKLRQAGGAEGEKIAAKLQGALPAIALSSHVSLTTAIANDTGADMVFAQQVYGIGRPGDGLLAITTSGDSPNVLAALLVAKAMELKTIALTGRSGGRAAALAEVVVRVAADAVPEVQELHLAVYHAWSMELEEQFFAA